MALLVCFILAVILNQSITTNVMAEKRTARPLDLEASIVNGSPSEAESLLLSSSDLAPRAKFVEPPSSKSTSATAVVTSTGLNVLILLAVQNCSKNLLLRYVMQDQPQFLTSAAVIGVEAIKLVLCVAYILFVDKQPFFSIITFLLEDWKNSLLLGVPAAAYSLQMSLEYVALANLNAAMFSVLVQCKLLFTATFATLVLGKQLRFIQVLSLVLLTTGVMLCNLQKLLNTGDTADEPGNAIKGITATLGIALSSGFASVYTEKVIKAQRAPQKERQSYSLAYMQVQLALVSLIIIGAYAMVMDFKAIIEYGLWHNFTKGAFLSIFNSAIGGLIVAAGAYRLSLLGVLSMAGRKHTFSNLVLLICFSGVTVLKFADSVLKGYATASKF
jgi:UDP-sugar transporter A1/2/3